MCSSLQSVFTWACFLCFKKNATLALKNYKKECNFSLHQLAWHTSIGIILIDSIKIAYGIQVAVLYTNRWSWAKQGSGPWAEQGSGPTIRPEASSITMLATAAWLQRFRTLLDQNKGQVCCLGPRSGRTSSPRPCLVPFEISKFYKISHHIESFNACTKY